MRRVKQVGQFIARAPKEGPRVLVADIETFPVKAYVWSLFKQNVGVDMIEDDFKLMSFCGKWLQDPAYFYIDNRDAAGGPRDDTDQGVAAWSILAETDFVIAHNGKKFDLRKLRARFAMLGLAPLPPVHVVDTLHLNASAFAFDSQRLAFVSKYFSETEKDKHAKFPGFEMWKQCMADNIEAWKANQKYNLADVTSTEEMYLALRGWYTNAPNFGPYFDNQGDEDFRCPNCGSSHVHKSKVRRTNLGIYQQYHCQGCGAYPRGRYMVVGKAERSHILVN